MRLRSIGIGERLLPRSDFTVCQQVVLIGSGVIWNLYFGVLSLIAGFFLATALAVAKNARNRWLRKPAEAFIFVFRGSPLFIQFFLAYEALVLLPKSGIPLFGITIDTSWTTRAWAGALFVLFLNTAAYSGEIFYGALLAVPRGDVEAADAYGMAGFTRFRRVIWPTMLRLAWPAYTNEAIFLFHATTLVYFSGFPAWQQKGDALVLRQVFRRQDLQPVHPLPDRRRLFHPDHPGDHRHLRADQPPAEPASAASVAAAAALPAAGDPMSWLDDHPEVRNIRVGAADLNGIARGKRVPVKFAAKLEVEGTRFPLSVLNLDIWGEDVEDSPLVFEIGDPDGVLMPDRARLCADALAAGADRAVAAWMYHEDGRPFDGDPRHALRAVLDRWSARGLTPVAATEMEFYLLDDSGKELRQAASQRSGKRRPGAETLSLRALDAFDSFFNDLYDACEQMDIPAEAAISEVGLGQFEINLVHQPDALKAADDAWLFKLLVRGLARNHGFAASFMAKPLEDYAGNGLHVHFSVEDAQGCNVFANGTHEGTALLRQAIAGCLRAIPDLALIFAPHGNSYERLVPESHAPTGICWAYDNRTASVRVPGGSFNARRVEHRVAGGDVNPYLFLAAVLGSALTGIEDALEPPPPITGNAYEIDLPQIPATWAEAIDAFEGSALVRRIFPEDLIRNLVMTKRQEAHYLEELTQEQQIELYLDTV